MPAYRYGREIRTSPFAPISSRSCPNMRTCWPGLTVSSFNPLVSDRSDMLRRIGMLSILLMRTGQDIFILVRQSMDPSMLPSILIGAISFCMVAYCMHLIGNMHGARRVFGAVWEKHHFDSFLGVMFFVHVGLVGGSYLSVLVTSVTMWNWLWVTMGLLIFLVAWVAWWDPEDAVTLPI
ncbi:hypothetical protein BU16DRAFT_529123 [Lophium mytilinum]|uniref:Uncharacterized protein n=1 Tax=Lophium mytilinum TaxID=390894 RepID=A0A6A6QKJ5_9PEZI|nr:hypothetical protein BU16DRAFT_529123 [Lophium mytilinum]